MQNPQYLLYNGHMASVLQAKLQQVVKRSTTVQQQLQEAGKKLTEQPTPQEESGVATPPPTV